MGVRFPSLRNLMFSYTIQHKGQAFKKEKISKVKFVAPVFIIWHSRFGDRTQCEINFFKISKSCENKFQMKINHLYSSD